VKNLRLGRTGLNVSRICLGAMSYGDPAWRKWVLPEEESRPFIKRALELGINFFDTANMYSLGRSEEVLGRALRDFARREEVVIATKVYFPVGPGPNDRGLSRKHILQSIDDSLRRLGTDYVDLYQIHRWDYNTPIEETMEALHDVVRAGKARYLGASSMFAWQFATALHVAERNHWTRFVSMQNHYNLVYREEEREMLPLCRAEGIGVLPWSPLARGLLTGNRGRSSTYATTRAEADDYGHRLYNMEPDFQVADRVAEVAAARGVPRAHIALAWLLRQPGVTAPIIGATKLPQLEEAVGAVELQLSDAECTALEAPYQPHRVLGHD
jgi:aryl-alcohol dehydrogenase (NADP+)